VVPVAAKEGVEVRVLGIDPGSRFMGFGVVESRSGALVHVGHGVIKADANAALEHRLQHLHRELTRAIALYQPVAVAVEGLFSHRNARSALVLGHARGVALLAAAQGGLDVHEYAPAKVKKSVGAGGADGKDGVARMVRTFLGVAEGERADATDALAVAICHLNHVRVVLPRAASGTRRGAGAKGALALLEGRISSGYRRPVAG